MIDEFRIENIIDSFKSFKGMDIYEVDKPFYDFGIILCEYILGIREKMSYPSDDDYPYHGSKESANK